MRKFLLKIILFLGLSVVLLVIGDLWISKTLAKSEAYAMGDAFIWNAILNKEINADLLIYGSSRAWRHFDPEMIEKKTGLKAYNFGVDGHTFDIQNLRHELYLKYNKPPKVIVYSVDVNTLGISEGLYNDEQFLPFFYSDPMFNEYTKKYVNFSSVDYNMPLMRYSARKKALTYFVKETIHWPQTSIRRKGFKASKDSWNTDYEKARKNKANYYKEINQNLVKRFDLFLKNARSKNINVILMYAPEHLLGQSLIENRATIIDVFSDLAKNNNVPFIDYSKGVINTNKDFFYNSLHLNARGVEAFNRLYLEDLKKFIDTKNSN